MFYYYKIAIIKNIYAMLKKFLRFQKEKLNFLVNFLINF